MVYVPFQYGHLSFLYLNDMFQFRYLYFDVLTHIGHPDKILVYFLVFLDFGV